MSFKFGWDFIKALKPAKYKYIEEKDDGFTHFGVMAQDIKGYLDNASDEKFAVVLVDNKGKLMVNYNELIAPMISTIQELQRKVDALEYEASKANIHTTLFK